MDKLERQIIAWHKSNSESQRLATIPQFGPIISSAVVASMGNASRSKRRAYGASLGLVPRQNSTGGKPHLGPITKAGDHYIRRLLVNAAAGMVRRVRANPDLMPWFAKLLARKPAKEAIVALANKLARIAWAILSQRRGLSSVDDHHSLGRNALIVAESIKDQGSQKQRLRELRGQ